MGTRLCSFPLIYKGMGEPLDNYSAVLSTIHAVTDPSTWGMAHQRVCVSTVGLVPRIKQLSIDAPRTSLALSLHAPTQVFFSSHIYCKPRYVSL